MPDYNEHTTLKHSINQSATYAHFQLNDDEKSPQTTKKATTEAAASTKTTKETTKRCINQHMLSSKLTYFLNNAKYSMLEYWVLYYVSTGLNSAEAGLINGIQIIGGTIAAPLWGLLADRRGCHRTLMVLLCLAAMITTVVQPFLSERYGDDCKMVCRHRMNVLNDTAYLDCRRRSGEFMSSTVSSGNNNIVLFYSLLLASSVASVFDGSILSFVDSGVLHRIRTSPQPCEYGHQRLFGSLGYGIGAMVYSAAVNYFPDGDVSCYCGLFVVYFVVTALLAISSFFLYSGVDITSEDNVTMSDIRTALWSVAQNGECVFVFLTVLVNGAFQGLWYAFLFIYLKVNFFCTSIDHQNSNVSI